MTRLIRAHPLTAYVVLAYVFSITIGLLLNVSLAFGLLALFGPAAAAVVVAGVWRGRAGIAQFDWPYVSPRPRGKCAARGPCTSVFSAEG